MRRVLYIPEYSTFNILYSLPRLAPHPASTIFVQSQSSSLLCVELENSRGGIYTTKFAFLAHASPADVGQISQVKILVSRVILLHDFLLLPAAQVQCICRFQDFERSKRCAGYLLLKHVFFPTTTLSTMILVTDLTWIVFKFWHVSLIFTVFFRLS